MFQPGRKLLSNRTLIREERGKPEKKKNQYKDPSSPDLCFLLFRSVCFCFIFFVFFPFLFLKEKSRKDVDECGCWEDLEGILRGETTIRTFCVLFQLRKKIICNICVFSVSLQLLIVQSDYSCRMYSNEILRVLCQWLWSMTKLQNYRMNLATVDCFLMPHVWGHWNLCIR